MYYELLHYQCYKIIMHMDAKKQIRCILYNKIVLMALYHQQCSLLRMKNASSFDSFNQQLNLLTPQEEPDDTQTIILHASMN